MMMEDVAIVSVKMSSSVYTRFQRSIRMSFTDKIAAFGKFVGATHIRSG